MLAGIVSALLGNPGLTEVVAQGVLMAWAYGESIMDLRVLTAGGKVPSVKTKETWKLSLSGLLKLGTTQDSGSSSADRSPPPGDGGASDATAAAAAPVRGPPSKALPM